MGFTPRDVDGMSLWELAMCVDGFNRSRGAEEIPTPMSNDEFENMIERHRPLATMQ